MRKVIWAGAAACAVAGGLGVYLALQPGPAAPVGQGPAEEQEPAVAQTAHPAPPVAAARETERLPEQREAVEVFEPIVVEGAGAEPPPAPEVGGETVPGKDRSGAVPGQQPPRPDEEPGRERRMPYAEERGVGLWVGVAVCEVLDRLVGEAEALAGVPDEWVPAATEEPPMAVPDLMSGPPRDAHYHRPCCPYTGHCPIPFHPLPPPPPPMGGMDPNE
jgi:hypothetical protein